MGTEKIPQHIRDKLEENKAIILKESYDKQIKERVESNDYPQEDSDKL